MKQRKSGQESKERHAVWYQKICLIGANWTAGQKKSRIAMMMVTAFLLGRVSVIGATSPFGLGLFAAVLVYSPLWAWKVFLCMILGAFSVQEVGDGLLLISSALLLWQGSIHWGSRQRAVRIPLMGGLSYLGIGWLYQLLIDGSLYDGLIVFFSSVLVVLSASMMLYGFRVFVQRDTRDYLPTGQVQEGFLAMVMVASLAVSGIGDVTIGGLGVQMAAGSLLVLGLLSVTKLGVALAGCIGIGFVIGMSDGNVSMTMAEYAMAGLAGGAMQSRAKIGISGGFLAGLGGMLLAFDPYGEWWYRMGEAMMGVGIFLLLPMRYIRAMRQYLDEVTLQGGGERRIAIAREKLQALEKLFLYMAEVGEQGNMRPIADQQQGQTAAILAAIEESACTVCEKRKDCWEEDFFVVSQEVLSLADDVSEGNRKMREAFKLRCPSSERIEDALTKVMREQSQARYWKIQCGVRQSLLVQQMRSLGGIFRQMESELLPMTESYQKKKEQIAKRCIAWQAQLEDMTFDEVDGTVCIEISCSSCGGNRVCEMKYLPFLERVLAMRLRMSVMCGTQNNVRRCRLFFTTQERVQVLAGMAGFAAQEDTSGDTYEMITISTGKVAILLSDGMGHGVKASADSQETIALLKELLIAGFAAETAVQTVNAFWGLYAEKERFSTVDVLVINKYTGEAEFIKIGAPPAFVKRQAEVLVVQNDSLPLGIVRELELKPISIMLEDGDFVVMMSDGVLDIPQQRLPSGHTQESWVRSQIRLFSGKSPQSLAEHIAQMAIRLSGRTIGDDMTVVVLKIKTISRGL